MANLHVNVLLVVVTITFILYILDEKFNSAPILEKPLGKKLGKKKRKTYEEFVAIAKVDPKHIIGIPWIQLPDLDGFLPTYLKYKEKLLTPVLNQGKCASCWSISVVHHLADRISVYTGGRVKEPLSTQELMSCWEGTEGNEGCSIGGIPELAYHYIVKNGISLEKDYPYKQSKTTKVKDCDKSKLNGKKVFVEQGSVRSLCIDPNNFREGSRQWKNTIELNVKNMRKELLINGPFVCTIMVHQNLYDYDGLSVYTGPKGSEFIGGHSLVVLGHAEQDINGVEEGFDHSYWICKNSWSDWPLKSPASEGYFYIEAGKNVAGIESRASRALPVLDENVRSKMVKSLDESRYTSYDDYVNDPERKLLITKVGRIRGLLK